MKKLLIAVFALVGISGIAQEYIDLSDVKVVECVTDSGRTKVYVEKGSRWHEITVIQNGRAILDRVKTNLDVAESFPAGYYYRGRTSGNLYLSLGQTTKDMENFSQVKGTVYYTKNGQRMSPRVTCEVTGH